MSSSLHVSTCVLSVAIICLLVCVHVSEARRHKGGKRNYDDQPIKRREGESQQVLDAIAQTALKPIYDRLYAERVKKYRLEYFVADLVLEYIKRPKSIDEDIYYIKARIAYRKNSPIPPFFEEYEGTILSAPHLKILKNTKSGEVTLLRYIINKGRHAKLDTEELDSLGEIPD